MALDASPLEDPPTRRATHLLTCLLHSDLERMPHSHLGEVGHAKPSAFLSQTNQARIQQTGDATYPRIAIMLRICDGLLRPGQAFPFPAAQGYPAQASPRRE